MDKKIFSMMEEYMFSCMEDSAHDKEHIYRVLYNAMEIAGTEEGVDYDVLIAACLLHDIGRGEQYKNPAICHATAGGEMAYSFLTDHGFEEDYAQRVKQCIQTHRYRKGNLPQTIEAKILFDADKLDASGAIGIARTLIYKGIVNEPIYTVGRDGTVLNGEGDSEPSFFQEYKYKLEKIYSNFYTARGGELARERQKTAADFYAGLYEEVSRPYKNGREELARVME